MVRLPNTRELTRQAADELLAKDPPLAPEKITVDKIYAVIQQGSRTTINDELKAWRADKLKPEIPKELLDLWSDAVQRAKEVFAQDRERMEAEVAEANRQADELRTENEGLHREAESREARFKEKSNEAENLRMELTATKSEAERNREIARVNQEAAECALAATRDRAEAAERAAREVAENLAAQRLEHARLEAELRQEFRNASDRQIALVDKVRLDLAQSVAASKELENHLGATRAQSENLSREIDRLNGEASQLKADLAAARTETEASNRGAREVTGALHAAEIEATRLRTTLQAKEEALQVETTRRAAIDNAVTELRAHLKSPNQNA
jgi:chromosome segregation ATPase